jgi:hypothetical protein
MHCLLNLCQSIAYHVPHHRLPFWGFLLAHLLYELYFLLLQTLQLFFNQTLLIFRLWFTRRVGIILVIFIFVLGFVEPLIDMGLLEDRVVEVDFSLDFWIGLSVRVGWGLIEFRLELLIVGLDGFTVMFDDALFSELFVLIDFFSPLLEELVHLFFAG